MASLAEIQKAIRIQEAVVQVEHLKIDDDHRALQIQRDAVHADELQPVHAKMAAVESRMDALKVPLLAEKAKLQAMRDQEAAHPDYVVPEGSA